MPTRRTATLLTIMRLERGHGTEAQSLSRDSAGLRRYKSQSAILYWIRRRRRRWRESCAGRSQERTPAGPGESGQNTTMGGLPSSIAPGDAVACRDRDQLGPGRVCRRRIRGGQSVGVSRPTVWRWQQRFAESGVEGLLRDKTRKPGKAPLAAETTAQVVALTCTAPPHQATHWTGRAMAKATGISVGSVQRIWRAHKLQPHRLRTFKRSRDPSFAAKLTDIVGLYIDPPAHAVVLSIDEKSQIQALDRTQPGLPIKSCR